VTAPRRRVLAIGLDSADADLIEKWADEGHLPTLAALRREGTWARLGTTADVLHVSAWPTIYTGASPGHHGMYHAFQIRAGERAIHRARAEECGLPPFWKILDDAGVKCLVMDAFMDYRLKDFRGVQITEYGTWTWFTKPASTPSDVRREILRRFGPYPAPEHTNLFTVPDPRTFRDQLVAGATVKGRVVRWLLREKPWEMAFVTFGEPHAGGHYLWHVSDHEYPSHPIGGAAGAEHALRDVYAAVDQAIGEIVSAVDDSTTVMIVSGDGMGPNYSGCHLLPEVLNRLGLFYGTSVGGDPDGEEGRADRSRPGLAAMLRQAIPLGLRHAVTRCLPRSLHYWLNLRWANQAIDWDRSQAFCIPNSNEGYVRLNLRGREPGGIVETGAMFQELLETIHEAVEELVVPTGEARPAREVFHMDQVFSGPRRGDLPDLVVTWNPNARVLGDLRSERCGLVHGPAGYQVAPYYTGNHRPNAFVLCRGPRAASRITLERGHILDIPATILTILGIDLPAYFEGRAWSEFVTA